MRTTTALVLQEFDDASPAPRARRRRMSGDKSGVAGGGGARRGHGDTVAVLPDDATPIILGYWQVTHDADAPARLPETTTVL
jgi:hypothetical protein